MKRINIALLLLAVFAMVLSACAAPAAAPAGDTAASDGGGEAAAMECTDEIGCIEVAPGDPIHIGGMLTISGATSFLGEDSRGGIEIAIDDRGGELLGHPLELTVEDSLCSAEGGQTAAQKVASDPTIVGVIGTNCSSAAAAALPIISSAGLVLISLLQHRADADQCRRRRRRHLAAGLLPHGTQRPLPGSCRG